MAELSCRDAGLARRDPARDYGRFLAPDYVDHGGEHVTTYVIEPLGREPVGEVVLCHCTPWSSAVLATVARRLGSDRRVFVYGMPGYGASICTRHSDVDLVAQRRRFAALPQNLHHALVR